MEQTRAAQMQSQRRMEASGAVLGSCVPKQSSANEVCDRLSAIADRAQNLAARVDSVLQPISREVEPTNVQGEKDSAWHPPLFENYLGHANTINYALMRIESALDRLEI